MAYMLLIVEPVGQRAERGVEAGQQLYERMLGFTQELKDAGVLMASSSLATAATRLRREAGAPFVTDGPFTESKEMIGGFFLVDCASHAEAVQWAVRCPAASWATVEVRETGPCFT
jgi:hypothetical protein